ncbi:tetratricopeptide repeat protein [uncultured Enterococcus sp.]|uniref:tetratricopeptide repeat protein n=1 Tax=uncultured Enterococcus sp. TaxID=167972 RepID=UPI0025E9E2AE|nr:tetratricopeptide repeat protein [uncultured Enterococcus sp.]
MKCTIQKAIELRKQGKLQEAISLLFTIYDIHSNDGYLNYQIAWSYDNLEEERKAVLFYEKAISYGLEEKDLQEAYLGLGSTYRVIGEYEKSCAVYQEAIARFPENRALEVFYSMTLFNLEKHEQAMEILLRLLATTSDDRDIRNFERAILFYADKLNQTFS